MILGDKLMRRENSEKITLIYREGNGKNEAKIFVGYGISVIKNTIRISLNHKNVWDLRREWEMKSSIMRKAFSFMGAKYPV